MSPVRRQIAGGLLAILLPAVAIGGPALPDAAGTPAGGSGGPEPWPDQALPDVEAGAAVRRSLPFSLDQTRRIHALDRARRRTEAFARPVPENGARSIHLAHGAGQPAPVIRAAQGYVTAVVFLDVTGAPWPVARVLMRPEFRAGGDADGAGHVVYVAPERAFDHGNIMVELEGHDLPVSLAVLVDDGERADFRVAVRLPHPGPAAAAAAVRRRGRLRAGDPLLGRFGAGAAPPDAVRAAVSGGDRRDRAWRWRGRLYLKSPRTLLAPGPLGFERGPDGDWIYELPDIPFAIVSDGEARARLGFDAGPLLPALAATPPAMPAPAAAPTVRPQRPDIGPGRGLQP